MQFLGTCTNVLVFKTMASNYFLLFVPIVVLYTSIINIISSFVECIEIKNFQSDIDLLASTEHVLLFGFLFMEPALIWDS